MPKIVNVVGVGNVAFPDNFTEDQMADVLRSNPPVAEGFERPYQEPPAPTEDEIARSVAAQGYVQNRYQPESTLLTPEMALAREAEAAKALESQRARTSTIASQFDDLIEGTTGSQRQILMQQKREALEPRGVSVLEEKTPMEQVTSPIVPLPRIPRGGGPVVETLSGVGNAVIGLAEFFSSPLGVATLGIGSLPKTAQKAVAGAFAYDMGSQVPELARELGSELGLPPEQRNTQKISELISSAAINTGFTVGGALKATGFGERVIPATERQSAVGVQPIETAKVVQKGVQSGLERSAVELARVATEPVRAADVVKESLTTEPTVKAQDVLPVVETKPLSAVPPEQSGLGAGAATTPSPEPLKVTAPTQPISPTPTESPPIGQGRVVPQAKEGEVSVAESGINTGALGESGMGGAKPGEFKTEPGAATAMKFRKIDEERQQRGLEPLSKSESVSDQQQIDKAMAKLDLDPALPEKLIAELKESPRPLSDVDTEVLLLRKIDLKNEYNRTTREISEAYEDGRVDDVTRLSEIATDFSNKLTELEEASRLSGTEKGRALRAQRVMAYEDFSLAQMEFNKRAAKGGAPLTPEERIQLIEQQKKIEATQKAYDDYVARTDERLSALEAAKAVADLQREQQPRIHPKILEQAESIVQKMESAGNAALARLREKLKTASSGVDPTILSDLAIYGAGKLARGGIEFAKWADVMVKDLGEVVRPYLDEAWKASNAMLESTARKAPRAVGETVRKISRGDTPEQRQTVLKDAIGARIKEGDTAHLTPLVQKLARGFVEQGVKDRDALIDAVHSVLKETNPEITRREAMDAISGYGDYKQLSKDQVSVELRDLKGQMQQVAKLEDITSKQPPLKTGVERRTPSDEERRLLKLVNEAKKKYGVAVTDPARQLKSSLDAIKTRLKNQIADLDNQIATGTKLIKQKSGVQYDAEANRLKTERDTLKAKFDEVFGKPEMTDEQRVRMAIGAVERSITDLEQRIKTGDVGPRSRASRTPQTPELEAAKARREALKAELAEMRELDAGWQAEQAAKKLESQKESLTESIAEMERKLETGDVETKGRPVDRPAQPELEQLKQQRDVLSKRLRDARKKPAEQKAAEALQRRIDGLNERIAEREQQIASGDIAAKGAQVNRPLQPGVEEARQRLDELNQQIAKLRKGPTKTHEEIALQSLKTRLKNRTAELQEKLAAGDFAPRPKRTIALDAEANRLKFENEKAKRAYYEALFKDRMARRSVPAKILGGGAEVLNTSRAVLTSADFSAVLRQGGFIAFSHPVLAAKSLPAMFRAFRSERNQHAVDQEILSRPNYPLYKSAGLYLSEHGLDLSRMEEAYMSRWAEKIPLVAGSQRAYTTFLNKLRADTFDALAKTLPNEGQPTPVQAKALANFINVATGRGSFGANPQAAVALNTVFFAPRYVASRFQLLAGQPLWKGDAAARKMVAKEYARFLLGIGVVYGLGALAGGEIEKDPRSSDFGKIKMGKTRIDPMAGLAQVTTFVSRVLGGKTKTLKGEVLSIRDPKNAFKTGNTWDVMARFARTKFAPAIGFTVDVLTGKDVIGQPVTAASIPQKTLVPISLQDIFQTMREQGVPKGVAMGLLSIFGMGVQTYEDKRNGSSPAPRKQFGGRVSD